MIQGEQIRIDCLFLAQSKHTKDTLLLLGAVGGHINGNKIRIGVIQVDQGWADLGAEREAGEKALSCCSV